MKPYTINVAEQVKDGTYVYYFSIDTYMTGNQLSQLLFEQKEMYPWPKFQVSLYQNTLTRKSIAPQVEELMS